MDSTVVRLHNVHQFVQYTHTEHRLSLLLVLTPDGHVIGVERDHFAATAAVVAVVVAVVTAAAAAAAAAAATAVAAVPAG